MSGQSMGSKITVITRRIIHSLLSCFIDGIPMSAFRIQTVERFSMVSNLETGR